MKRIVYFAIGTFLLLLIMGGAIGAFISRNNSNVTTNTHPMGVLTEEVDWGKTVQVIDCFFVNDKRILYQGVEIYDGYAAIPLIEFLRVSGGNVVWTSDDKATIKLNNKEYVIDLESVWFGQTGDEFNYFHAVYGESYSPIRKRQGQELLIDTIALVSITQIIGSRAEIRIEDNVFISWNSGPGSHGDGSVSS